MAIIQPKIIVPDELYEKYLNGETEIRGLAIDADNKRVQKHLDLASDSDTDLQNEENQDANSNGAGDTFLMGLCAVVVVGITLGGVWLYKKFSKRKIDNFKRCLRDYIEAVNGQCLKTEHIDNLLKALDKINGKKQKKIKLEFSGNEIIDLVDCLCNYTRHLAETNDLEFNSEFSEEEQKDVVMKLKKNLLYQRDILVKAA